MAVDEHTLYKQIADFMQLQYPGVLYRFDLAADLKLTPGQAAKHKRLHPRRGHPDMFISEPKIARKETGMPEAPFFTTVQCGLYLELKKEGEKLYPGSRSHPCNHYKSKDGIEYKTDHLREQADYLYDLRNKKYEAQFAIGFDDAIQQIKEYLGEPHKEKVEF